MLWNKGRLWRGIIGIMMSMAPENIPADPRPAIARPAMKTDELGAAPQMAEPISKIITHIKKTLSIYVSYILPMKSPR